eukprot:362191-Chlamydomonas_euryale.AAC.1
MASLRVGEPPMYHACARQLARLLDEANLPAQAVPRGGGSGGAGDGRVAAGTEDGIDALSVAAGMCAPPQPLQQQRRQEQQQQVLPRRVPPVTSRCLTSAVHSCVSVGYVPWALIESAGACGVRLSRRLSAMTPRWKEPAGPPPGLTAAVRRRRFARRPAASPAVRLRVAQQLTRAAGDLAAAAAEEEERVHHLQGQVRTEQSRPRPLQQQHAPRTELQQHQQPPQQHQHQREVGHQQSAPQQAAAVAEPVCAIELGVALRNVCTGAVQRAAALR